CAARGAQEAVRGRDELGRDAGLVGGMAGVADDAQVGLGPALVQLVRRDHRADDVVTALDDDGRHVCEHAHVVEQLVLVREKAAVHEVVGLDARGRERELVLAELPRALLVGPERARRALPDRPGAGRGKPRRAVVREQAAVIGGEQIAALVFRDRRQIVLPALGEDHARAVLVEPLELLAPQQKNAAQHELADGLRMLLGVCERERAAPGPAEDEPARYTQVRAQALGGGGEMPGRVRLERRVRPAAPRAALIENADAVAGRVEEAPRVDVAAAARAAVHEQRRFTRGIAALLVVDRVTVADVEKARVVGLDRRIKRLRLHLRENPRTRRRFVTGGGRAYTAWQLVESGRIVAVDSARSDRLQSDRGLERGCHLDAWSAT